MIHYDSTKNKKSIGYMMKNHRDEILSIKSSNEAHELMSKLFIENNIDTPKSRQILLKLNSGMSYQSTVLFLNNILMKAQGLGTL